MNNNNLVVIKDKDLKFYDVNDCFAELYGFSARKDLLGLNDFDLTSFACINSYCKSKIIAEDFIAEDEICLRGGRVVVFGAIPIHGMLQYQIVHKSPYMLNDNETIDGVVIHVTKLPYITPATTKSLLNNPDIKISTHTELILDAKKLVPHRQYKLTKRELECIKLLVDGCSAKSIAAKLNLSTRTIEYYIRNIKEKLNVNKTINIVTKAVYEGLID